MRTPITVTTAKALGRRASSRCFLPAAQGQVLRIGPGPSVGRQADCSLPSLQVKSEDFATLKRLVPLLEDVSRVHPEPVIQELAADLAISICTHAAFSTGAVCAAACKTLGRSSGGPAGQARAVSTGTPDETPRPVAPLPQKPPRELSGEHQGAESVSEESSAPCPPQSLRKLLLEAYDPDIPTRAAALHRLSRAIEQRDPGALKIQEKLLKVGNGSALREEP